MTRYNSSKSASTVRLAVLLSLGLFIGHSDLLTDSAAADQESEKQEGVVERGIDKPQVSPLPSEKGFPLPDLVVTHMALTGVPAVNPATNRVEVPLRVTILNQGKGVAGKFATEVTYTNSADSTTHLIPFTVPGQTDIWRPYTASNLLSGTQVTFDGKLVFHPSVRHITATLNAYADVCTGEFDPKFCGVQESNETNNKSAGVFVQLP